MDSRAVPGRRYRHFKGGEYVVLGVAVHTETGEELVVYREAGDAEGRTWARSRAMFEGLTDGGVQRFVPVG